LQDLVGALHLTPVGDVHLTKAGAALNGKAFLRSAPLQRELREKTLEAWVRLDNLIQRGGGVLSVQTPDGGVFDAIVFGEQEPQRWMAGSNGFVRYRSFNGSAEAHQADEIVHVAITYGTDERSPATATASRMATLIAAVARPRSQAARRTSSWVAGMNPAVGTGCCWERWSRPGSMIESSPRMNLRRRLS
jgi:hypothetical protein